MESIRQNLEAEHRQVDDFVRLYCLPGLDPSLMVYDEWNTHDVLVHVLVWHESFARNVDALARGLPPTPEFGRIREINDRGMAKYGDIPVRTLLRHLRRAQRTIDDHILDNKVELIPYRVDGPSYSPAKHLEIVGGHVRLHFWDVLSVQVGGHGRPNPDGAPRNHACPDIPQQEPNKTPLAK